MYGKQSYSEVLGRDVNPSAAVTIADSGDMVVAFSNLLKRYFETDVPPDQLNTIFRNRGIFLAGIDKAEDELSWHSITGYNGRVKVKDTGSGWPSVDCAIVAMRNGQQTSVHVVSNCMAGKIIDSSDGQEKDASVYGTALVWASYDAVQPFQLSPQPVYAISSQPLDTGLSMDDMLTALRPPVGITSYQKPAAKKSTTRTSLANNRTGITYQLLTDPDNQPIVKRMFVSNKSGTVKRSFSLGMTSSMKLIGDPLNYRDPIDIAGTATNRLGQVMYMTVEDVSDFYHLWRVKHDYGYLANDISETKPVIPVTTKWEDAPTPTVGNPIPTVVSAPVDPVLPQWLQEAEPVQHTEWLLERNVWIIDLMTMKPIKERGKHRKIELTYSIIKDGIQYARIHPQYTNYDTSLIYAIPAIDPTTGKENLSQWHEPKPSVLDNIDTQWALGLLSESKQKFMDIIDVIKRPSKK